MKKIFISLACLSVLLVFSGSAVAYTYVVYKQANGPCTTGNYYYNDSQSYTCSKQSLERTPPPACDSININYGCGPIQYAYDSAYNNPAYPDTVVVCPGDYYENLVLPGSNITLSGPSTRNPNDPMNPANNAIIHAKNPKQHAIFLSRGKYKTITGLTITGATGTNPCLTEYITYCDPAFPDYNAQKCYNLCQCFSTTNMCRGVCTSNGQNAAQCNYWMNEDQLRPPQTCAGIRAYGVNGDYSSNNPPPPPDLLTNMCPITDNSITGNRTGIVIKDTAYGWLFSCRIENNDIYGNLDAGVYFQYGRESSILNNYIHDNTIGIRFADTVNNKIIGNSIENNTKGIVLTKLVCTDQNSGDTASTKWDTACPIPIVSGNQIYYNNIISNDTQVSDINRVCGDSDGCNTWYNSTLLEGNYWSNYTGLDNGYGGRIAGDGIGDTGIIPFPSAGYDNYPLVDKDKDETPDIFDNCPGISNPDQKDSNKNGKGDLCDTCPLCAWAPSNLTVTATYQSQINLSWKDNSTDEIDFRIYGKIDGDDAYERIGKVGANVTTYPHKSLQEYTTYYYRVRAYNGLVSSPYSNTVSATTRLNKPTALTATAVSASRINLSWTDNSSKEAGFEIQGKRGSTGTYSAIATVGPNVNSYANTGLVSKATYYYRVRAFNGTDDSAFSNAASATTQ